MRRGKFVVWLSVWLSLCSLVLACGTNEKGGTTLQAAGKSLGAATVDEAQEFQAGVQENIRKAEVATAEAERVVAEQKAKALAQAKREAAAKAAAQRPTGARASRSQGAGCTTGSANRYAPNANCSGCESRNVQQYNGSGKYWGKYQFDYSTWVRHGGASEKYGNASEAEQDAVAARVQYDAWPRC